MIITTNKINKSVGNVYLNILIFNVYFFKKIIIIKIKILKFINVIKNNSHCIFLLTKNIKQKNIEQKIILKFLLKKVNKFFNEEQKCLKNNLID